MELAVWPYNVAANPYPKSPTPFPPPKHLSPLRVEVSWTRTHVKLLPAATCVAGHIVDALTSTTATVLESESTARTSEDKATRASQRSLAVQHPSLCFVAVTVTVA